MNCTITGPNIKVFGKVIHCLAKFGTELSVFDTADGLALRTVNNSKSAYASAVLSKTFFHEYDNFIDDEDDDSASSRFNCRINMKVILGVFKSLPVIEKSVEKCQLTAADDGTKLTIKFSCRCDIIKTYELNVIETEILGTVYSKENCQNQISMPIKVLSDILQTFSNKQIEVTLSANQDFVVVENNLEDQGNNKELIHTKLKLLSDEFENYQIANDDTSITFCLKELRGIVQFSEVVDLPVEAFFSSAGRPIVFSFSVKNLIEADFVLATLNASLPSSPETSRSQTTTNLPNRQLARKRQRNARTDEIRGLASPAAGPSASRTYDDDDNDLNVMVSKHEKVSTYTNAVSTPFVDMSALKSAFVNDDQSVFKVRTVSQSKNKAFSIFDTPVPPERSSSDYTKLASDTEDENEDG